MTVGSSMGIGGSGGLFNRKTELVADLTSAFKTLNAELEKTKKLSEDISRNLKAAKPSGGGGDLFDTSSRSSGTKDPIQNDGSQGGGGGFSLGGFAKGLLNYGGKALALGMQAAPTLQEVFQQNASASMAGFANGSSDPTKFGARQQLGLARAGTFGSTEDVYEAQRAMTSYAMQGKNSAVFQANVAAMSNLSPGISGGQAAAAVQALNQGRNVNMLRMIGVNVRGADGMMRGFQDIAKDLWKTLNRQKQGGQALSKNDILFSLQPGNALDSLMNQYFGNDQVLRQNVTNELLILAGGGGGNIKRDAQSQGLITGAMASQATKVASQVNVQQAAAKFELKGMEEANKALTTLNNHFADLITKSKILQKVLEGKGFLDTMATAGHGAGSGIMALAAGGAMSLGKGLWKGAKSLFNWGKKGVSAVEEEAGAVGKTGLKWGSKALAPIAALLSGYEGYNARKKNKGKFDWGSVGRHAGEAFVVGEAVGGAETFGISGLVAALLAGGGDIVGQLMQGGDKQGGDDSANFTNVNTALSRPLAGDPQITSGFGIVRFLHTNQGRNASWGKPHGGVDYGVSEGTPVFAVKDGQVNPNTFDPHGFGNYLSLQHDDGKTTFYGHLSRFVASPNSKVKAGDLIGYSGNTGNSTGAHLHFEVRDGSTKLNPLDYLSGANLSPDSAGGATAHPLHNGLRIQGGSSGLTLPGGGEGTVGAPVNGARAKHQDNNATPINYGGVTITMNFPAGNYNKDEIKEAVREVISHDNIRKHAVSR